MKWLIRGQNISVSVVMELFIRMSQYALTVVFGTSFLGRKRSTMRGWRKKTPIEIKVEKLIKQSIENFGRRVK